MTTSQDYPPEEVAPLLDELQSRHAGVRLHAIIALWNGPGTPGVVAALGLIARTDEDPMVRRAAKTALLSVAPEPDAEIIDEFLGERNEASVVLAVNALRRIRASFDPVQFAIERMRQSFQWISPKLLHLVWDLAPSRVPDVLAEVIQADDAGARWWMVQALTELPAPDRIPWLERLAQDRCEFVRHAAYAELLPAQPSQATRWLVAALREGSIPLQLSRIDVLPPGIAVSEIVAALQPIASADKDTRTRYLARMVLLRVAPEQCGEFIGEVLGDACFCGDDEDTSIAHAETAVKALAQIPDCDPVQFAIEHVRHADRFAGPLLLRLVHDRAPSRIPAAIAEALESDRSEVRRAAAAFLPATAEIIPWLERLSQDADGEVRLAALQTLLRVPSDQTRQRRFVALRHEDASIRALALDELSRSDDPLLADDLLPLARDEDEEVRQKALEVLAKFDDPRVFSELVSSLNDVDEDVRNTARALLERGPQAAPVLALFRAEPGEPPVWEQMRGRVETINAWARAQGQELLGPPIIVHQYRQGLGRTSAPVKHAPIEIEVSDTPVTSGHPDGADVMRGLVLHELGHHLFDIGVRGLKSIRRQARAEGVGEIFDILLDERLERALRSRQPDWGVYLDRLNSYAFAQPIERVALEDYARAVEREPEDVRKSIQGGDLPGELTAGADGRTYVRLRAADFLSIPGLLPPLMAFLMCLIGGFDPRRHPNPKVTEAIAEIPGTLKDLPHAEVLRVARRIADRLGRSEEQQRQMELLRQRMRAHGRLLRQLRRALDRLANCGQLPDWACPPEAAGIRRDPLPPESATPLRVRVTSRPPRGRKAVGGQTLNLGKELEFPPLRNEVKLPFDSAGHAAIVNQIRPHIRRLRAHFERLGRRTVEEYGTRHGHRLDLAAARRIAFRPSVHLLVHTREESLCDAYLGLLIDRSSSMRGPKIELAKVFGVLVAEAAQGLRSITGHVNAFDDDTFHVLGDFRRNAIASLEAGGGNNDAAALERAANLALHSGKRHKLLILLSDGSPSACSVEALRGVVQRVTRAGIVCVHVALEPLEHPAFPHWILLDQHAMDPAIARLGRLLRQLTADWR